MKNNAVAPHPNGDPENLIDSTTGTIMKIQMVRSKISLSPFINLNHIRTDRSDIVLKDNLKYPAFEEGEKVYSTLIELEGEDG